MCSLPVLYSPLAFWSCDGFSRRALLSCRAFLASALPAKGRFMLGREVMLSLLSAPELESFVSGGSPGASLAVWQLLLKGDKHFVNKQGAWGTAPADRGRY